MHQYIWSAGNRRTASNPTQREVHQIVCSILSVREMTMRKYKMNTTVVTLETAKV